jgi:nitrite reductase/ring-hydroxylating ferredoxin subunit
LGHLYAWLANGLPVLYALSVGLRSGPALARRRPATLPMLLSLIGLAGLFAVRELAKRLEPDETTASPADELADGTFVPVAMLADLLPGTMTTVEIDNYSIALTPIAGQVYAFNNLCPHRDGPLAEGTLIGDTVTCPWHDSSFNVRTGAVSGGPARRGVPTYAVRVEGDQVFVQHPAKG